MKTNIRLLTYIAQFFLECKMFQTKFVGKIKRDFVSKNYFLISCRLWENVEKHCRAGQVSDDKVMRHMRIADGYLELQINFQNM